MEKVIQFNYDELGLLLEALEFFKDREELDLREILSEDYRTIRIPGPDRTIEEAVNADARLNGLKALIEKLNTENWKANS